MRGDEHARHPAARYAVSGTGMKTGTRTRSSTNSVDKVTPTTVELRLIGSKQDLKAAASLLYEAMDGRFAMKNVYRGEKGDFVAKATLQLEDAEK